jgi:ABC-type multidrug transport system ATPase subunit
VRQLGETLGTTILITTHLMEEGDEMCDRIGVLHAGKLDDRHARRTEGEIWPRRQRQ